VAHLKAEDVDWEKSVVSFFRSKTGTAQIIHFGTELAGGVAGIARIRGVISSSCGNGQKTSGESVSTRLPPRSSPFKNVFSRSSRGNEAQISLETIIHSEPPHVGCYFFNGRVGVAGISLHSYRNAWAERAKKVGYEPPDDGMD
jgi:hypothetical protein